MLLRLPCASLIIVPAMWEIPQELTRKDSKVTFEVVKVLGSQL